MMNGQTPKATEKFSMKLGSKQKDSKGFNRVGSSAEKMEQMNMDSPSQLDSGKKVKTSPLAKYEGFGKLQGGIEKEGYSKEEAGAIAASIGRKKYGKKKFDKAAASGKSLRGAKPKKK